MHALISFLLKHEAGSALSDAAIRTSVRLSVCLSHMPLAQEHTLYICTLKVEPTESDRNRSKAVAGTTSDAFDLWPSPATYRFTARYLVSVCREWLPRVWLKRAFTKCLADYFVSSWTWKLEHVQSMIGLYLTCSGRQATRMRRQRFARNLHASWTRKSFLMTSRDARWVMSTCSTSWRSLGMA